MGSRKCGSCLSCLLIPLALWSIIVNILLYFPNGQAFYASSNKLSSYVWYFEGLCFSGVMMLIVAAVLLGLDHDNNYKCCQSENCSRKYMTMLSIIFSSLGITFSGYCLVISALGLVQGPYCRTQDGWQYAFEDSAGGFLTNSSMWTQCLEPAHVVEWNVILFSILIALSGLQVIVCLTRLVVQLSKILCGTYSVIIQVSTANHRQPYGREARLVDAERDTGTGAGLRREAAALLALRMEDGAHPRERIWHLEVCPTVTETTVQVPSTLSLQEEADCLPGKQQPSRCGGENQVLTR
ncbi:transmembrane 4 L6 family member 18 [Ctenodactylus gundi]